MFDALMEHVDVFKSKVMGFTHGPPEPIVTNAVVNPYKWPKIHGITGVK